MRRALIQHITKPYGKMNRYRIQIIWLSATLFLCLCFLSLSGGYLGYVKDTIRQDAKGNLGELGDHISQSLNQEIENTIDVLGSLAFTIGRGIFSSEEELIDFLEEQSLFWGFYDLAVIDRNGIAIHQDGIRNTPANRDLLADALLHESTEYDFLAEGDEDCVVFYCPLPYEARKSGGYLAVMGTYAVRNWNFLMDIDIYDHQAVPQILTKDGVIVTRSRNAGAAPIYNFLDTLSDAEFEEGADLSLVRKTLKDGETLQTSYKLGGKEYYLTCVPLEFNVWSLVFTVPASTVNSAGEQMAHSVIAIAAALLIIFLILLIGIQFIQARAKKKIWTAAYVDDVTGGANKHKFELDAKELLSWGGNAYTLIYTNIDQFKLFNQRFGKEEADNILRTVGSAIEGSLKERECCARVTADHFVMLMRGNQIEDRLSALAGEQAFQVLPSGASCSVRLTFGACPVEPGVRELTPVIDRANLAMKLAPRSGSVLSVYNTEMMEKAAREKALTECLQKETVRDEFFIHLQPKVDLATGLVMGAEALARWYSPKFGLISPGEFIPLAERAGRICEIDWAAFECVCRLLAGWKKEGRELLPVSFNLSKAQLAEPDFLNRYKNILRQYEIPCKYLDFEFTESLLYENSGALQKAVVEIHAMGAQCSVDDFGFGYSSLGLLGQFEADTLKLDRSFFLTGDYRPDSRSNRIVRSIIRLADSLGMSTVAEGVEEGDQAEMLRDFGCGAIQGFYYSRPLPAEEFERYTDERRKTAKTPRKRED